jgi:probable HAF family extracellular repeat protein
MGLAVGALVAAATSLGGTWVQPALAQGAGTARYVITDLGTLGGSFSGALGVNDGGQVTGFSGTPADAALRGFLWQNGRMIDIGTLGGPLSVGGDINSSGQIAAWGNLTTLAPHSIFNQESFFCSPPMAAGDATVACHAFLWDHGKKTDLGTLGGLNSTAENRGLNEAGHIVGAAETTTVDPTSPYGAPAFHAFLWRRGKMTDLGTLTGTPNSIAYAVNDLDQVVGADLADSTAFHNQVGWIWQNGRKVAVGTLGGRFSAPVALNDRGQVVGASSVSGDTAGHAFQWQRGRMTDLGVLPGDTQSQASDVANQGQIVGESCSPTQCRATLWRDDKVVDLNTAIPRGSGWDLSEADAVNARGQIVGAGLHNGEFHAFLMTPVN